MTRKAVVLSIAAVVAVFAIAWWAWPGPAPLATQAAARPASAATASAAPAIASAVHLADDPRCVAKAPVAASQAEAGADASPMPLDPRERASRARLLARMGASPDPYANAVAVWLDVDAGSDEDHLADRQRKLASMAAATKDPRLYSLALRSCWRHPAHPCGPGLSARRWAELEPANAFPWLMIFDDAAEHGDRSSMEDAMSHVTRARRLAERLDAPLQPIVDAAGDDVESVLAARALAERAVGISAAQAGTHGFFACSRATTPNVDVWQECVAMADLLARHSDTLQDVSLGEALRQRLTGVPKSPEDVFTLERMREKEEALFTSSSCDELRDQLAILRRMAVEGEVAVARDLAR